MASIFRLSPANPLQFFHQNDIFGNLSAATANMGALNPNYNNYEFDTDLFARNIKPFLMQRGYASPWQVNDVVKVQWVGKDYSSLGLGEDYIVYLLDKNGYTVKTLSIGTDIKYTDLAGGTESVYLATCLLWDVEEGIYFVQCYKRGSGPDPDYWLISEPIEVKENWEGTSLVKYKNSYNAYGLYFDMTTVTVCFQRRFFGCLQEFTPQSNFEVYEDDPRDLQMLGGDAYRSWTFSISNKKGVPDYEKDKLERIFLHDEVTVDGRSVTRESGSKVEASVINGMALHNVSIKLREKNSTANLDIPNLGGNIDVAVYPSSKVFWVDNLVFQGLYDLPVQKFFTSKARFLGYMNNGWLEAYTHHLTEDTMFMAVDGRGKIVLKANNQDDFDDWSGTVIDTILPYWIKMDTHLYGVNTTSITTITVPSGTRHYAVSLSDNTVLESLTAITTDTDVTRVSPNDETYYIFMDYAHILNISGDSVTIGLDGEIPPTTVTLEIESNILRDFGADFFNLANGTFNNLDLLANNLSNTSVNKILLQSYEALKAKRISATTTIDISGGTNSAPSNDVFVYISQIVNSGGTVAHN